MGVLVEEEGGRLVLSQKVKEIMIEYENVKKIPSENDSDQATFPEQTQSTFPDSTHTSSSQPTFTDNTSSNLTSNSKLKRPRKRAKKTNSNSKDVGEPLEKKPRSDSSTIRYLKMESEKEYQENIMKRIERVLKKASEGADEPITYYRYEMAVCQQPRKGSEVLLWFCRFPQSPPESCQENLWLSLHLWFPRQ